jgi:hypothetical protein
MLPFDGERGDSSTKKKLPRLLQKVLCILRLRAVVGIRIHHQLGIRHVLSQEEAIDGGDDDVSTSVHDQYGLVNLCQHGRAIPIRPRRSPTKGSKSQACSGLPLPCATCSCSLPVRAGFAAWRHQSRPAIRAAGGDNPRSRTRPSLFRHTRHASRGTRRLRDRCPRGKRARGVVRRRDPACPRGLADETVRQCDCAARRGTVASVIGYRAPSGGTRLGVACVDQPSLPLARPRQDCGGSRPSGRLVQLVQRGVCDCRSLSSVLPAEEYGQLERICCCHQTANEILDPRRTYATR